MRKYFIMSALTAQGFLAWPLGSAWAQQGPYTYIRASLQLPWTLYFFFLLMISIPFAVMIFIAWRNAPREEERTIPPDKTKIGHDPEAAACAASEKARAP